MILAAAGAVSFVFQRIRQPLVLGYIIAGLLIGPHMFSYRMVLDLPNIRIWAELGVIFLMFSLGLEFSFRKLAKVGISASVTSIFEVSAMALVGFGLGTFLGWSNWDRLFLGAMMAISSTTIIIKALDELKLKTRRFAEMIFGILIVEDLIAILMLVALSMLAASQTFSGLALLQSATRLVLVIASWFLAGYFVVPRMVRYVGRLGSDETLTLWSLGLCLLLVVLAAYFDYSVALGAFIMGSILAESTESHRIEELIRPLRDVFAAVFFVSVGMLIDPKVMIQHSGEILLIASALIAGKITFVTLGALITGQTLRTSVQVGFGLAQIGEFSFIIAGLGQVLGVTSSFLYPIAVSVSLITTLTTPAMIRYSHRFAVKLEGKLPLRLKDTLARYAAWSQERRANAAQRAVFYRLFFRWLLNGIVVTVIFILCGEWLLPKLIAGMSSSERAQILGWSAAVVLSAPFIWAMFSLFKEFTLAPGTAQGPRGGTLFMVRLVSIGWIGALSLEFFPVRYAVLISGTVGLFLFLVVYRQLKASYEWFERRFLATFEPAQKSQRATDVLRHLAPWDAHLVRIKVHPNADIAGKRLLDSRLRTDFGLNVVAIQRGLKTMVAPNPEDLIFPKDELLVLGTDEQIERVRPAIEKPPGLAERFRHISGYQLQNLLVTDGSWLNGKAIRETGLRERFGAMVVGLERRGMRLINPSSDLKLETGDLLYLVGEIERLTKFLEDTDTST